MLKTTVIVPTYNRPRELHLCLTSLARQSLLPAEVLIADDGSGPETAAAIRAFSDSPACPFPVRHLWQEDDGFRKPRILNETVRHARGDYLVFIDGDCTAHRHFLRSHLQAAEPMAILGGKRVNLGPAISAALLATGEPLSRLTPAVLWDSIRGGTRKAEEGVRITLPWLRRLLGRDRITDDGIWGCNFSLSRDLFYAINGCDEEFLDGSIEDNDLGIRVLNTGGQIKSVRALAIVFHLWHRESWDFHNDKYLHNKEILERRIALKEPRCRHGIVRDPEAPATPADRAGND